MFILETLASQTWTYYYVYYSIINTRTQIYFLFIKKSGTGIFLVYCTNTHMYVYVHTMCRNG